MGKKSKCSASVIFPPAGSSSSFESCIRRRELTPQRGGSFDEQIGALAWVSLRKKVSSFFSLVPWEVTEMASLLLLI